MAVAKVGVRKSAGRKAADRPPPAAVDGPVADGCPAQSAYERLILCIQAFEEGLNADQEVVVGFAGAETGVLSIESLGYFAPDIITFDGYDEDGVRTQLIQHVSQLNVMLRAMPKPEDTDEPRRIGFDLAARLTRK